jgi:hypothetical protein
VRDVADQFGPLRRKLLLEEPFEQALADLPGHRRLFPADCVNGGQVLRDDVGPGIHADGSFRSCIGYSAEGVG